MFLLRSEAESSADFQSAVSPQVSGHREAQGELWPV